MITGTIIIFSMFSGVGLIVYLLDKLCDWLHYNC